MKFDKKKENIILSIDEFNMFEETVGTFVIQVGQSPECMRFVQEKLKPEYVHAKVLLNQIKEDLGEH